MDKIDLTKILWIWGIINLNGKYMWVITNVNIEKIREIKITNIKKLNFNICYICETFLKNR